MVVCWWRPGTAVGTGRGDWGGAGRRIGWALATAVVCSSLLTGIRAAPAAASGSATPLDANGDRIADSLQRDLAGRGDNTAVPVLVDFKASAAATAAGTGPTLAGVTVRRRYRH